MALKIYRVHGFFKKNVCILGFFHEINKPACHHNLIIISIHIKVKCFARTFAAADISTKSRNVYHYGLLRIHDFISLNHVSCFLDKSHFFTRFFSDEFFHFSCIVYICHFRQQSCQIFDRIWDYRKMPFMARGDHMSMLIKAS